MTACTVVIPNWNGKPFLEPCLEALRAQTFRDFETVLVDNGSADGSVELVEEQFPEVLVLRLETNRGFAGAMNAGIDAGEGQYVAFLNNDTRVEPRWLEELVLCLERHPKAAGASSKTLALDDPDTVDAAGDVMTWAFLPHPRGHGEPDRGQFEDEVEVLSPSGTAALWRRLILEELGAFDERFFAYYEDVDLGLRARLAGYECWYAPRSVVLHHRGGTAQEHVDFTYFHPVKNRWFMILKDTPGRLLLRHLAYILYGDFVWWRRAIRHRKVGAVLRAYGQLVGNLGGVLRDRRRVQRGRRLDPKDLDRQLSRDLR